MLQVGQFWVPFPCGGGPPGFRGARPGWFGWCGQAPVDPGGGVVVPLSIRLVPLLAPAHN